MTTAKTSPTQTSQPPSLVVGLDRAGELVAQSDVAFNALVQRPADQKAGRAIVSAEQIAQLLTPG